MLSLSYVALGNVILFREFVRSDKQIIKIFLCWSLWGILCFLFVVMYLCWWIERLILNQFGKFIVFLAVLKATLCKFFCSKLTKLVYFINSYLVLSNLIWMAIIGNLQRRRHTYKLQFFGYPPFFHDWDSFDVVSDLRTDKVFTCNHEHSGAHQTIRFTHAELLSRTLVISKTMFLRN